MFDARNDPEKYAKGITDSLEGVAKLNGDEFTISTYELQRLEEAGKALGFSGEQMAEMAKQKAKMDKVGGSLSMFSDPKDRELLSGMVEFKDGKAMIEGEALRGMSEERKKDLLATVKTREQNAKDAMATREMWTNIMNQVQSTFLPLMQTFEGVVRPMVESLSEFIKNWPVTTVLKSLSQSSLKVVVEVHQVHNLPSKTKLPTQLKKPLRVVVLVSHLKV